MPPSDRRLLRHSLFALFSTLLAITSVPLFAQARWGEITAKGCVDQTTREWSGILWDIPWGQSWEIACATTAGVIGGRTRTPDRCVTMANMWGVWYVPDTTCGAPLSPSPPPPPVQPRWGEITAKDALTVRHGNGREFCGTFHGVRHGRRRAPRHLA